MSDSGAGTLTDDRSDLCRAAAHEPDERRAAALHTACRGCACACHAAAPAERGAAGGAP